MNFDKEKNTLLSFIEFKPEGCFLAGGALTSVFTNNTIKDYDLYFKSKKAFIDALEYAYEYGLWCVHFSSRAITFAYGNDVYQLMYFDWFDCAEKIFDKFDFTACMGALDLDTKQFVFHDRFMADLAKRELNFNHKTLYPLASGLRTLKYQSKGFTLSKFELTKILTACVFKDINNWDDLKNQLGGNYGNKVNLNSTKEFNLENAIEALSTPVDLRTEVNRLLKLDPVPYCFEEAYRKIFNEEPSEVLA